MKRGREKSKGYREEGEILKGLNRGGKGGRIKKRQRSAEKGKERRECLESSKE